jgi:hypothetical protein
LDGSDGLLSFLSKIVRMQKLQSVPVLMYHSVGIPNPVWIWRFLTLPHQIFKDHLRVLKTKGFCTIDLRQLYDYVEEGKPIPSNSIVLTLDDGYLDNWIFAYPLLKKHGFKGTIFVNPEFVDPTEEYRPNLEDVWKGNVKEEDLNSHGFLSWREMREMESTGVMDIQSHGMTHTWYFSGPEIIDFRHPGDPYVWMNWNKGINKKHKYLTENQDDLMELGTPVYQHEKSLATLQYYQDKSLDETLVQYVKSNGGKNFFENQSWREELFRVAGEFKSKNSLTDCYESEEEQKKRYEWELKESKEILEKELNKKIQFLCWPGGGKNELSIETSKRYYLASTMSWRNEINRINSFGGNPSIIQRIGIPYLGDEKGSNNNLKYLPGSYLYWVIQEFKGNFLHRHVRKLLKLYHLINARS